MYANISHIFSIYIVLKGAEVTVYSILLIIIGFLVGAWITRLLLRYPFGRHPVTGKETLIGMRGVVVRSTDDLIEVKLSNKQIWRAMSVDGHKISTGTDIIVKNVDNLTVVIEEVGASNSTN
ncbi:MAG: NfeD family protein [Candidatus Thermoplasmatota archaeon]|nr:NfeD family protein [Candidatus Thermoplasmatota archaeon]